MKLNVTIALVAVCLVSCISAPTTPVTTLPVTPESLLGLIEKSLSTNDGIGALALVTDYEGRGFDQAENKALHERFLQAQKKSLILSDGAVSRSMVQFVSDSLDSPTELAARVDLLNTIAVDSVREICSQLKSLGKLTVIRQLAAAVRKDRATLMLSYLDQPPPPPPPPPPGPITLKPDQIASVLGLANPDKQKERIRYSTKGAVTTVFLNEQGTVASWDANMKGGGDGHLKVLEDPELLGRVANLINLASGKSDMTRDKLVSLLAAKDAKPKLNAGRYTVTLGIVSAANLRFQGAVGVK